MSSLAKHVIHRPKPYRTLLFIVLAIVATYALQQYRHQQQNQQHLSLVQQQDQQFDDLMNRHKQLEVKYNQLVIDYNKLDATAQNQQYELAIQHATSQQLQRQLVDLQSQLIFANKELAFYQKITQGNSNSKLQIRELQLSSNKSNPNIVHYRFVITQGRKVKKPMTGLVTMSLNLTNAEQATSLGELPLKLRYVQIFEGQIKLTDQQQPKSITITLKQGKKTTLSQIFAWQINTQ